MHQLQFLRSEFSLLDENWKYRGVPIFAKKEKESLRCHVWYGSKVYNLPNTFVARNVIDSLVWLAEQCAELPHYLVCPKCGKECSNSTFAAHWTHKHVENMSDTHKVMSQFLIHFGGVDEPASNLRIDIPDFRIWAGVGSEADAIREAA